ncbi:unnamed protein product [Dovyalis caffra]|uniref:Uncharacterized protein n=1 Tax=Dovyalis caffra TaxID=77055 RepID=A0AAV1R9Z7_9ROSI|nr:unnamed protein product [Dovyalis caffra]
MCSVESARNAETEKEEDSGFGAVVEERREARVKKRRGVGEEEERREEGEEEEEEDWEGRREVDGSRELWRWRRVFSSEEEERDLFQVEVGEAAGREGDLGWTVGVVWLRSGVFSSGIIITIL